MDNERPKYFRETVTQQGIQDFLEGTPLDRVRESCHERSRSRHVPSELPEIDFNSLDLLDNEMLQLHIRTASSERRAAMNELGVYHGATTLLTLLTIAERLTDADLNIGCITEEPKKEVKTPYNSTTPYPILFTETIERLASQMTHTEQDVRAMLGEEFLTMYSHADGRCRYYHAALCAFNEEWQKRDNDVHPIIPERLLNVDPRSYLEDWEALKPTDDLSQYVSQDSEGIVDDRIHNIASVAKILWVSSLAIEQKYPDAPIEEVTRILLQNVNEELGNIARNRLETAEIMKMDLEVYYHEEANRFSTLIEYAVNPATAPQLDEGNVLHYPSHDTSQRGRCPIQYHAKLDTRTRQLLDNFLDVVDKNLGVRPEIIDGSYVNIAPLFTTLIICQAAQADSFLSHSIGDLTEQFLRDFEHYPPSSW